MWWWPCRGWVMVDAATQSRQAKRIRQPANDSWRARLLVLIFSVGAAVLCIRAVDLQVRDHDFLAGEGAKRHVRSLSVPGTRGAIRDRRGDPLALAAPVESIWAVPGVLLDKPEQIPNLANLLETQPAALKKSLEARSEKKFMYLRRQLDPSTAERVMALQAPGVFLQREYRRYYPAAEVAAQLVGLTDIDIRGQEGIELALDDVLHGAAGARRVIKDRVGRVADDLAQFKPPRNGQDVHLSIDLRLQYLAYRELKAAVAEHNARGGMMVMVDPDTGEVLASVSYPSVNPNRREAAASQGLKNRPATDLFEPGSTVKPLVVAKALDERLFNASSHLATHGGKYRVGRLLVKDFRDYGDVTLERLLVKSSNVGAAKIGLALGAKRLWDSYESLGFGEHSGVGFPGEEDGVLRSAEEWGEIGTATASYGYGLSVTALQLARAYAAIAADGVIRPLSLLRVDEAVSGERVISVRSARQVRQFMEAVTQPEGTATKAAVEGYRVAGKTGTVRKVMAGGYTKDIHQALFVGMVPAGDPRLVAMVIVDEPGKGQYYGGLVAAPVFSRVMSRALQILQIPPDEVNLVEDHAADRGARS